MLPANLVDMLNGINTADRESNVNQDTPPST